MYSTARIVIAPMHYKGRRDVVVLALPRGGIPVAYEIGKELGARVDVFVVRKLGVSGQEEPVLRQNRIGSSIVDRSINKMKGSNDRADASE